MKSNGYRLTRHESDEAILDSGAMSCRSFRIMTQGVPGNGEVKDLKSVSVAKANVRRQQGTRCVRL
jgi:hypothetical protein